MTTKTRKKAEKRLEKALNSIEKKLQQAQSAVGQGSLFGQMDMLSNGTATETVDAAETTQLQARIKELQEENTMYEEEVERLTSELQQTRELLKKVAGKVDGTIEEVEKLMKEAA